MGTRISGIASGMDIDTMVTKLMTAERAPLDKMKQEKQTIEWKRDSYRDVYSQFLTFKNSAFDMKLQSNYMAKQASSSDEVYLSASATAAAVEGNHEIKVTQLAKSASVVSQAALGVSNSSATMSQLGLTGETTLTVAGEKGVTAIQVKTTDKLSDVVANINNKARYTGVTASYDSTLDRFFFTNAVTGSDSKIEVKSTSAEMLNTVLKLPGTSTQTAKGQSVTAGRVYTGGLIDTVLKKDTTNPTATIPDQKLRLVYNNMTYDFEISSTTTVGDLMDKVNTSDLGKLGVSVQLDSANKMKFFNPDDDKAIEFQEITDPTKPDHVELLEELGILTSSGTTSVTSVSNLDYTKLTTSGVNAKIEYNGIPVSYKTNTFAINGINFTAKKVTPDAVSVSIASDAGSIYDKITDFVDNYNKLIDAVNSKTSEAKYRDFTPLTDAQKEDMKEEEIERWEAKAKSGMLRGDSMLTNSLQSLRNSLNSAISGLGANNLKQLVEIGITTGSYTEQGKLYVDETKLKKAISEQPDQVMALFTADDKVSSDSGDGLAVRMYNQADRMLTQLKEEAGTSSSGSQDYLEGKRLDDLDKRIQAMTDRMKDVEDRYYNQFTAMEKYINQMNSQSSWLAQQFSSSQ